MHAFRRIALIFGLLAAGSPSAISASTPGAEPVPLQPGRLGWVRIDMGARKLFMQATTVAEWTVQSGSLAGRRLVQFPRAEVLPPGPEILVLQVLAEIPGTRSATTLWMDPGNGNSLQYEMLDSGRRYRERIVRFGPDGAYQRTRRPRESEDERAPDSWTDTASDFWPYGRDVAGAPVLDSLALLYAIAGAALDEPGDKLEVLVYQRRELVRVLLMVDREASTPVAYRATGTDGTLQCRGPARALRVVLKVLPLASGAADFDFLGLKSDIAVLVEPGMRLPLRIEGRAAVIGQVTSSLRAVRLKAAAACPDGLRGTPD